MPTAPAGPRGLELEVLALMLRRRRLTKQEIAAALGRSIPAVTTHVRSLVAAGYLEEAGAGGSTGGRRPLLLDFKPRSRLLVAADIRPDRVRAVLADLDATILREATLPIHPHSSGEVLLEQVTACVLEVLPKSRPKRDLVVGLGLSLPGTVHPETLEMEFAPNLGLKNTRFDRLGDRLSLPVRIENEANAAAIAELHSGAHGSRRHLVYVSVTQGIGVGVVLDGRLYRGAKGAAGEFGHMTIVSDGGRRCSCGRSGCWERYASVAALIEDFSGLGPEKAWDRLDGFRSALVRGDGAALGALERTVDFLATGIGNLSAGLDPDRIVVGGRLADSKSTGVDPGLLESMLRERLPLIDVCVSGLGDDAAIQGAALLARSSIIPSEEVLPLL